MKKTMKRLLALIMAILMCFSASSVVFACPVPYLPPIEGAEDREPVDPDNPGGSSDNSEVVKSFSEGYYSCDYTEKSGCVITYVSGSIAGDVVIPDTLGGYSVTSIDGKAFALCDRIKSVTIPEGVISIGEGCFEHCKNLETVTIPDSVTSIGISAFLGCTSLKSVIIGGGAIGIWAFRNCTNLKQLILRNGVTKIDGEAFEYCENLENIEIPDSVKSIGDEAFSYCTSLKSISISENIESIGDCAFRGCSSLKSITVDKDNAYYTSDNYGVLFNKDKTKLMQYSPASSHTSYEIPDGVTEIGCSAFKNSTNLKEIIVPASVATIGCSTAKTLAPECTSLEKIIVDENNAHFSNDERGVLFNKDKTVLIMYPLGNSATSYIVPETVTTVYQEAFYSCQNLTDIYRLGSYNGYIQTGNATIHYCEKVETDATCTEDGVIRYVCTKCADNVVAKIVTPAFGHSFTNYIIDNNATCTADGTKTSKCDRCTVTKTIADTGSALGHNMGSYVVVTKPTATTEGLKRSDCSRCDYYETMKIPVNIYNLGEETYKFNNFGDTHSEYGHCFGMSITSSGYYIGSLDKSILGGDDDAMLFSYDLTSAVQEPICHYQRIQGCAAEYNSMVAGGSIDLKRSINTQADWNACVNYVKSHNYDNKGSLQIGMWLKGGGGHAVNFLYYANVNGQDRIYVYDNNLPNTETYYYMGSDGYIHQYAPGYIISWSIIGLNLTNAYSYFNLASEFKASRYIYANKDEILVENAVAIDMKTLDKTGTNIMFELPEGTNEIKIIPLVDNAEFEYLDSTYNFAGVNEETYGKLSLTKNGDTGFTFEIHNSPDDCSCNCHAGGIKAFFFKIINFFQKLFGQNKVCACGAKH